MLITGLLTLILGDKDGPDGLGLILTLGLILGLMLGLKLGLMLKLGL